MKNLLIILGMILICSCIQTTPQQKSNQIESQKKDSIYCAEKKEKALIHADSIFTGFMNLKWNSSKKEAIKYFKTSKELKISVISRELKIDVDLDDDVYLKGSFAGRKVEYILLKYFNDKLHRVDVDFGYQSDIFYKTLVEKLENKYGKPYITEKFCSWDFDISTSEENKPEILISNDSEGLALIYISKYSDKYEKEEKQLKDSKEKSSIKLNDL